MALPQNVWLAQAQRLAVGMSIRVKHGLETRMNMTVGNERDHWWAYCQRCKQGGRLDKTHVLLTDKAPAPPEPKTIPGDMIPVLGSDYEAAVVAFLAGKGMDVVMLPDLWYSPLSKRLWLRDDEGRWHGRDLTGRSDMKWAHINAHYSGRAKSLNAHMLSHSTIITEDIFSMYKVRYALRGFKPYDEGRLTVASTLGASCGKPHVLWLKDSGYIIWFYDADKAGDDGYKHGRTRMAPFVKLQRQLRARPPEGKDPKDMSCDEIRAELERASDEHDKAYTEG